MNSPTAQAPGLAPTATWVMLTAQGALRAFSQRQPDATAAALQSLLSKPQAQLRSDWESSGGPSEALWHEALAEGWIQPLKRALVAPDARLDDFVQHVIAALSGERRAVLASDTGFCLGRAGLSQDEADTLSAAAADLSAFAARQAKRGWTGAGAFVSFTTDPTLLLPDTSFVPFWVDGAGYVLVLFGEPLLNNPALVELVWGIRMAGTRFASGA